MRPIDSSRGRSDFHHEVILNEKAGVFVLPSFKGRHYHGDGGSFDIQNDGQFYFIDEGHKVVIPQELVNALGGEIFGPLVLSSYQWAYDSNNVAILVQAKAKKP